MIDAKIALGNLTFGSGGGLRASVGYMRDTLKFAYKASTSVCADGSVLLMSKDPITDPGKESKEGFLSVEKSEDGSCRVSSVLSLEAYPKTLEKSMCSRPTTMAVS